MVIIGLSLLFIIILGVIIFITGYQYDSRLTMILGFLVMFAAVIPLVFH